MGEIDYPPLFESADSVSMRGQRRHRAVVIGNLIMITLAAAFAVVALISHETVRWVAVLSTAATLLAGIAITRFGGRSRDDRLWFNGRAVAETVKSLTWRYMMRVPPFESDATADTVFNQAIDDVSRETPGIQAERRSGWVQITPQMREVRALDLAGRRDFYARARLEDQVGWYAGKSVRNSRDARRWSRITLSSQIGAIVATILTIVWWWGWVQVVGLLATMAAAATAWTQFNQHELLTRTYAVAASELEQILELARSAETEEALNEVVRNGEGAISREHTLWTAKRND